MFVTIFRTNTQRSSISDNHKCDISEVPRYLACFKIGFKVLKLLVSISSTFYMCLFCGYFCAKKFTKPNVSREKLFNLLLYKKLTCKMLMKLTAGVNFINIFTYECRFSSFFQLHFGFEQTFIQKIVVFNVDEIDCRCQFHQHFYVRIFRTNVVSAAFSSYVLALAKNLYKKCARKMLMKLTAACLYRFL